MENNKSQCRITITLNKIVIDVTLQWDRKMYCRTLKIYQNKLIYRHIIHYSLNNLKTRQTDKQNFFLKIVLYTEYNI